MTNLKTLVAAQVKLETSKQQQQPQASSTSSSSSSPETHKKQAKAASVNKMNNDDKHQINNEEEPEIKCSAISTLERGMPTCDISQQTEELRNLMLADIEAEPDKYSELDVERLKNDAWQTQRYLIRCRLNVCAAHKMMKTSLQFKNSPIINNRQFPREFYQVGACFSYERDRKDNIVIFLRVKVNQKIPVVTQYLKSFLFSQIEKADIEARGKGVVLCFDLQGAGVSNVDMEFVYFVMSSLISYFPKGLSYILVHELPWYLRSVWTLARTWLSEDHRELIKFSNSETILEYIKRENLPDFMGGTCKRDYNQVPPNAITLKQASVAWNIPMSELYSVRKKYAKFLPENAQSCDDDHEGLD